MADINLLQNQLKDTSAIADRRSMTFIWIVGAVFLILLLGGGGLYFWTSSLGNKTNEVLASNNDLNLKISNASDDLDDARVFQAKLSNIDLLLDQHIYMTPLLEELEKATYQRALFLTTDITTNGKVHLEGQVSTYNDLGKLILGLTTSPNFRNVKLLAITPILTDQQTTYRFSIDLNPTANLFTNPIANQNQN